MIKISIPDVVSEDDIISCRIYYSGAPRIANNPPWGGGFVWETAPGGYPWIGVACEGEGGDIWWPCKDHPSDEPDSMNISLSVPQPLFCASNGQYLGFAHHNDGTSTYNWFVSVPINNYNVTFYAAPFFLIEYEHESLIGNNILFNFWVLPQNYYDAVNHLDVFDQEFNFLEDIFGPFPFGTDKHGWAHSPYYGMEHQSIIAYGNDFDVNGWGYDYIHYHELAHEWYGNLLTAKNWADIWIHEGVATYSEALYVEHLSGMEAYFNFMRGTQPSNNHSYPLAPYTDMTANEAFAYLNSYRRGASVMHTLRYHIGDELFFELLKRWAYPNPEDLGNDDGRQCRLVDTDDMKTQAEYVTGVDLDPFFTVFFREASYPQLQIIQEFNETHFEWLTETNVPLDLNVPILINGVEFTVEMENGMGSVAMNLNDELIIDPNDWILMADPDIILNINEKAKTTRNILHQNNPNPFANFTTIEYQVLKAGNITLNLMDYQGKHIKTLINKFHEPGCFNIRLNKGELCQGVYIYCLKTEDYTINRQMIIE
jgi:aminopeptidase N